MPALAYAVQILSALPSLIAAGANVVNLVNRSNAALQKMQAENRVPTDTEWDDLNAQIKALQAELHAP